MPSAIKVILPLHEGDKTISKHASCLIGEYVWFSPGMEVETPLAP